MEETLSSPKMAEIDLIHNLEKISSMIPNRILKLEGFFLKENQKEKLEIIIFKGFSSSTSHPIEIDLEKKYWNLNIQLQTLNFIKHPLQDSKITL